MTPEAVTTRRLRSWRERKDNGGMVELDMNWEEGELLGFIRNGSGTDATKAVSAKADGKRKRND